MRSPSTAASVHVHGVTKTFGGRRVIDIGDLTLGGHPIEGLIGPNGAGKTTLMRLIMNTVPVDSGSITLYGNGTDVMLSRRAPHAIPRLGVVKTNQVIQDFSSLTIWDSLMLASTAARDERPHRMFRERSLRRTNHHRIVQLVDRFEFGNPHGYAQSGGEKKLLDILRCLLLRPRLLLLDEPTAGLPDDVTDRVMELVVQMAHEGTSVVIIEHDLNLVWDHSQFVHFLAEGQLLLQGPPSEVRSHDTVIEKYLGASNA